MRNKIFRLVIVAALMSVAVCGCQKAPESSSNGDILHAKGSVENEVEAMWLALGKVPILNPIDLIRGDDLNNYPLSGVMECVYILLAAVLVMWGLKRRYRNGEI